MSENVLAGRAPLIFAWSERKAFIAPPVIERVSTRPFVFIHVGDLHITEPPIGTCPNDLVPQAESPCEPNARTDREDRLRDDLSAIFADIQSIKNQDSFDFVYLPGDLAENACKGEYDVLAGVLKGCPDIRVRLIPGDHDRARGNMCDFKHFREGLTGKHEHQTPNENKYEVPLETCPVPPNPCEELVKQFNFAEDFVSGDKKNDVRCIFLDLVSASDTRKVYPGLDFRLGKDQLLWFGDMLDDAKKNGMKCAVFMHCYPYDMGDHGEGADVAGLIWSYGVRLVEMGHTHYNEICHDGRSQYAAARSVGQNEDGPTGYAVVAIDGGVTSWRFRQLQLTWPFVMITSPADRRVANGPLEFSGTGPTGSPTVKVRALVLSDRPVRDCQCRVDNGRWTPMGPLVDGFFELEVEWPTGSKSISVSASGARRSFNDFIDIDTIEPVADDFKVGVPTKQLGSDKFAIGSWPEKGVRGDQLGPNKSGHKW